MFGLSPLLRAEPDWSTAPAMSSARACVVCGMATVGLESSFCFTHFRDEPDAAQEPLEVQEQAM